MTSREIECVLGGTLKLLLREPAPPPQCLVTLTFGAFSITARGDDMAYTLPADREVLVKVSYVDANGNPATVDGDPQWASSDEAIVIVIPNTTNAFECTVRPGAEVGQAQVSATVDADLGEGVRSLVTLMDVTVVGGEAVAGFIEPVGEAGPIPEPKTR